MVRPPTRQLSALKLPCAKPTRSHSAASDARRSATRRANTSAAARSAGPSSTMSAGEASPRGGRRRSRSSRKIACATIMRCSRFCSSVAVGALARRAKRSRCPTRTKDGATRVVMAACSMIATSGSRGCRESCRASWRRTSAGNRASRGSSSVTAGSPEAAARARSEYHGRLTDSEEDTTSDSARVVGTPRKCIASEARNSRIDDRSTARPSAPRQNGVRPPPLSWSS
mmetsp:Transcript_22435/g.89080  ORF Transcript_22435/g.89080 Transcript_22435/m.89080 type:complete len:228 (+) Transcript_22435:1144-1827(+)